MQVITIEGGDFLDKDAFDKLRKIFNTENTTKIKKNSKLYFTKNTDFNTFLLANTNQNISSIKKVAESDFIIYNPIFLDPQYLVFTDKKRILEDYEADDLIHEAIFPLAHLDHKDVKTIEAILESLKGNVKAKLVTELSLRRISNNNVVIDENNFEYIRDLMNSADKNNTNIGKELLNSCDMVKSKAFICYLATLYSLKDIPKIKEFIEAEFSTEISHITKDDLFQHAMKDSYVAGMIKQNILKALNTFISLNKHALNIPTAMRVSILNICL